VLLVIGALVALIPGINPIDLMIYSQVIQGILLPVTLLFIMRLVNDRDLMGDYVNSRLFNFAAWSVTVVVSILSVVLIVVTLQQAAGVIA